MKLADFICFDAVVPQVESTDRDGVIGELVSALVKAGKIKSAKRDEVTAAVIKRENEASTGIGKGVAVPHVKHSAVNKIVGTIGRSSVGIDFAALDRSPVYIVVLLLSPQDNPDRHLASMENIFRHLQRDNFRRFLRQASTKEAINELVLEADELPGE